MDAKTYYETVSSINGMHALVQGTITLKEEDLYKLMDEYAERAFDAARIYAKKNTYMYDRYADLVKDNPIKLEEEKQDDRTRENTIL